MATASIGVRERMAAASKRIARVKLADRAATGVITFGGVFIIVCVLFIFVFIFEEALPLFRGARAQKLGSVALAAAPAVGGGQPAAALAIGVDEYQKYLYEVEVRRSARALPAGRRRAAAGVRGRGARRGDSSPLRRAA